MATTLASLVSEVRLLSGLRSNQLYTDADIATMLADQWKDLYDRFISANQHYRVKTFDFTLTGNVGGNSVDLPDDFQLGNGLEMNPTFARPWSVGYLESWLNRNNLGASVLDNTGLISVPDGRRYCFNDSQLVVFPADRSAGDYRLYYTPMADTLKAQQTISFAIATGDTPQVPPPGSLAGAGAWLLANASTPDDLPDSGFDLVLTFLAPNTSFSGTYPVVDVGRTTDGFGSPTFSADNLVSTAGFTNPASGTGTFTYQPVGTTDTLPNMADPWALYLKLGASIAIREARQQDVADLQRRFQEQSARVSNALQNRQEEATQPPLTRGASYWDSL
jgi:hypothetical protein